MLSGFPNYWSSRKVDFNLRQAAPGAGLTGPFDRASIMLYRFPPSYYHTFPNGCTPEGSGDNLSLGDVAGLQACYPHDAPELRLLQDRQSKLQDVISKSPALSQETKGFYLLEK